MSKINETKTAKTPASGVPLKRLGSLETELIDKLFLELSQFTKAKTNAEINLQHKYNELIMAVERKHYKETRHQTALRYIRSCEMGTDQKCQREEG